MTYDRTRIKFQGKSPKTADMVIRFELFLILSADHVTVSVASLLDLRRFETRSAEVQDFAALHRGLSLWQLKRL